MTALILWLFGCLALASMIMVVSWGRASLRLYRDEQSHAFRDLRWNRALVIASAMTIHAAGMSVGTSYRTWDMLHGVTADGSAIWLLLLNMTMILGSKIGLIWGVAVEPNKRHVRWPWWAFLYAMMIWGVFVWVWAAGAIDMVGIGI